MRITLTDGVNSDMAKMLAKALCLQLILPGNSHDTISGLLSDDAAIQDIIKKLPQNSPANNASCGFILYRYPNNVIQAQSLDMALARVNQPLDTSIFVQTTKRQQNRENKSLIRYYQSQNKVILIDESFSLEDITSEISSIHQRRRSASE